jgi:hypothetical protein
MKLLKGFTASLYSEFLLAEKDEDPALNGAVEGDARGPGGDGKGTYERGLGELFGFPGDAKKLREKSKIRLWKEYLSSASSELQCIAVGALTCLLSVAMAAHGRSLTRTFASRKAFLAVGRRPPDPCLATASAPLPAVPAPSAGRSAVADARRTLGDVVWLHL